SGSPLAIISRMAFCNSRIIASVMTFDGSRLHTLAGPSLPPQYSAAVDNLEAGPLAGSCGAAAYFGEAVVVSDIETDPRWQD
ncbi:diguanylate cyclase, partial [Rhizobium ruizarguesonis]